MFGLSNATVSAETAFTTGEEINGTWILEYTTISDKKKLRGETWVFGNGTLVMKNIPQQRGSAYDAPPVDFAIENGKLKISILGRAGKFDIYSLIERKDNTLVLKSNLSEYYHFTKK